MDIEEGAASTPEKIQTVHIDPNFGLSGFQVRQIGFGLGLDAGQVKQLNGFLSGLYKLFVEKDASLAEINPLVVTKSGDLIALDAKRNFDDSALYRHPELRELRDPEEEDPRERAAKEIDLSYVGLDGDIGCMVNGAGLAMATMDVIKYVGGEPANFLDVGGGATAEKVTAAFKIITRDPNVKGIFVNIFGGIMKCEVIASGVVQAVKEVGLQVPLVVRLEGTNVEMGRKIIQESGLDVISAEDMKDGAQKIVELTK